MEPRVDLRIESKWAAQNKLGMGKGNGVCFMKIFFSDDEITVEILNINLKYDSVSKTE